MMFKPQVQSFDYNNSQKKFPFTELIQFLFRYFICHASRNGPKQLVPKQEVGAVRAAKTSCRKFHFNTDAFVGSWLTLSGDGTRVWCPTPAVRCAAEVGESRVCTNVLIFVTQGHVLPVLLQFWFLVHVEEKLKD
jgi:hypothetical protein